VPTITCASPGVAVQSNHLRFRYRGPHLFLDPLRSDAQLSDARTPAGRASVGGTRLAAPAPMADHELGGQGEGPLGAKRRPPAPGATEVECVRNVAGGTLRDEAAVAAEHDRREAAAIEVQDRLLAARDRALKRRAQCPRQRAPVAALELEPQIDDGRKRQRELADPLG